jgi:hypothetical protein
MPTRDQTVTERGPDQPAPLRAFFQHITARRVFQTAVTATAKRSTMVSRQDRKFAGRTVREPSLPLASVRPSPSGTRGMLCLLTS